MIHSHNLQASSPSGSTSASVNPEPWGTPHLPSAHAPQDSTREAATRVKNLARESTQEARTFVNEGAPRLSASARAWASTMLTKISHQARFTQNQLNGYAGGTTRYMATHPLRSAAASLFAGVLITQIIRGFRASRKH